jgi:hypothetical protein
MTVKEQLIKEIEEADDVQVEYLLKCFLLLKSATIPSALEIKPISASDNEVEQANTDRNSRPIWELFNEFTESLPPEAFEDLPADGAAQHDRYLYGTNVSYEGIIC